MAIAAIVGLILLIVLIWLVPYLVDIANSYGAAKAERHEILKALIGMEHGDRMTAADLREIAPMVLRAPTGIPTLARALMAFSVISIVGIALVLTLASGATDAGDLRKTIITALLATLSAIVGFYFGGKTAQEAAAATLQPPTPAPPTPGMVSLSPSGADFGVMPPGQPSDPRDFTVDNRTGQTIQVTAVTLEGDPGFEVTTAAPDDRKKWWIGKTLDVALEEQLLIRTTWTPPDDAEPGSAGNAVLMVSHTAPGAAPTARLKGTVEGTPQAAAPAEEAAVAEKGVSDEAEETSMRESYAGSAPGSE